MLQAAVAAGDLSAQTKEVTGWNGSGCLADRPPAVIDIVSPMSRRCLADVSPFYTTVRQLRAPPHEGATRAQLGPVCRAVRGRPAPNGHLGQRQLSQSHARSKARPVGAARPLSRRRLPGSHAASSLCRNAHRDTLPYTMLEDEWSAQRKFMRPLSAAELATVSSPFPSEDPTV